MLPHHLTLRRAQMSDALRLWEWRNEEGMRLASFQTAPVPLSDHLSWLTRIVADPTVLLLVASDRSGEDVGYIRFDINAREECAEVSVCLDQAQRGRGLGKAVIAAGCEVVWREHATVDIVALVKADNAASSAAFEAAGFEPTGTRLRDDVVVNELRRKRVTPV